MSEGDDPLFTFEHDGPREFPGLAAMNAMTPEEQKRLLFPRTLNPWVMREKFFKINDSTDALAFLREFGVWRFRRSDDDHPSFRFPHSWAYGTEKAEPFPIRFSELIYQRNCFEDALNCKPSDWLKRASISTGDLDHDAEVLWEVVYFGGGSSSFDLSIVDFRGSILPEPCYGSIFCSEIQDALRATVLLDWMEGREWPRCKACRRVFKRTSKHPQFYCCAACASRARQATFRKNRANQIESEE
jgi:hypothetical protein